MTSIQLLRKDPSDKTLAFEIQAEVWKKSRSRRCVILVPPTNGVTFLDRLLIDRLRKNSVHVIALTGFTGAWEATPDWRVHDRGLKRGQCAVLELMAWARKNWKVKNFSVIGLSMGALFAGMAAAASKDIDRMALVVGGAPIYKVAAQSWHPALLAIHRYRSRKFGALKHAGYALKLRRSIDVDLSDVAEPRPGRRVLLVIGKDDWIIPTARQYDLAERLKPETTIEVSGGHFAAMVMAETYYAQQICDHLVWPASN